MIEIRNFVRGLELDPRLPIVSDEQNLRIQELCSRQDSLILPVGVWDITPESVRAGFTQLILKVFLKGFGVYNISPNHDFGASLITHERRAMRFRGERSIVIPDDLPRIGVIGEHPDNPQRKILYGQISHLPGQSPTRIQGPIPFRRIL
jgi:hypothetical protein